MISLSEVAGIGDAISGKLNSMGINSVEELVNVGQDWSGVEEIASTANVSQEKVVDWIRMGDFFRLGDMKEGWSLLLYTIGIGSVKDLVGQKAGNLVSRMNGVKDNLQYGMKTDVPSLDTVKNWIGVAPSLPGLASLAEANRRFGWKSDIEGAGSVDTDVTMAAADLDMDSSVTAGETSYNADLDMDTDMNAGMNLSGDADMDMNLGGGKVTGGFDWSRLLWLALLGALLLGLLWALFNWNKLFGGVEDVVDNTTSQVSNAVDNATDTASNAVDNVVDVVTPDLNLTGALASLPRFNSLDTNLGKFGLKSVLNNADGEYTVFAPVNSGFDAVKTNLEGLSNTQVTDLLKNHVVTGKYTVADLTDGLELDTLGDKKLAFTVDGDKVMVNGVEVKAVEVDGVDSSLVYEVPSVLFADEYEAAEVVEEVVEEEVETEEEAEVVATTPASADGIYTMVSKNADLSILADLIKTAGLDTNLDSTTKYTLFAPTNAQFADVDVDALKADTDALAETLKKHVVAGELTGAQLQAGTTNTSLAGTALNSSYDVEEGESWLHINGDMTKHILKTDMNASNGPVHTIDTIL